MQEYDARRNGLTVIRIIAILLVIASHSFTIGKYGQSPIFFGQTLGGWGLAILFTVSGFLVANSRTKSTLANFVYSRFSRLYPAFFGALVVVAFGFAPAAYALESGSLDGFFGAPDGPFRYISSNIYLEMRQYSVSGTPGGDPYGWNGSAWTMFYVLMCYIVMAFLAAPAKPVVRLRVVATGFVVSVALHATAHYWMPYFQDARLEQLVRFMPYFLGGALLRFALQSRRLSIWTALFAAATAVVASSFLPTFAAQLFAPAIGYSIVTLATVIRTPRVIDRHDYSLGLYLYAFPVQQALMLMGLHRHVDVGVFFLASSLIATLFGIASLILVERPGTAFLRQFGERSVASGRSKPAPKDQQAAEQCPEVRLPST